MRPVAPELLRQSSETLAGRVRFVEMAGLSLAEVGPAQWRRRLVRGGFPPSFLARTDAASAAWREDFIRPRRHFFFLQTMSATVIHVPFGGRTSDRKRAEPPAGFWK